MTDYKLYPNLPSAPPENPQVAYYLSIIQAKMQGSKNKEQMFKQKYEKYNKILNRLTWLNACSSGISIATGLSSVATFVTFVGLPVSAALGAASMTGAIASGIILVLTKKYQKKLKKVTTLIDIVTPALVVFERVISGEIRTWGFWCSFQPLLHHTSSAHNGHSAPELISLSNCIRSWRKASSGGIWFKYMVLT